MIRDDIKDYNNDVTTLDDAGTTDKVLIEDEVRQNSEKEKKKLFGKNTKEKKVKEPKPPKEKKVKEPKSPKPPKEKKVKIPKDSGQKGNRLKGVLVFLKKLGIMIGTGAVKLVKQVIKLIKSYTDKEESEKRKQAMQEAFKKGKTSWYRGIRSKLIVAFLVPVILFIIASTQIYSKSSKALTNSYETAANSSVATLEQYLELGFDSIELMGTRLMVNGNIESYYTSVGVIDTTESDLMDVKLTISNEATADLYVRHIMIISPKADVCTDEGIKTGSVYDNFMASEEGKKVTEAGSLNDIWIKSHPTIDNDTGFNPNEYAIAYVKPLLNNRNKLVGYIIVDVKKSFVQDILDEADISKSCIKGFVAGEGAEVISGSDTMTFSDKAFYQDAVNSGKDSGHKYVTYKGKKYFFSYTKEPKSGAMVCALVPQNEMLAGAKVILDYTLIAILLCCVIAIVVGSIISTGMSKSLGTVNKVLKKTSDGDLTGTITMKRRDEFRILSFNILNMIDSMKKLIVKMTAVSGNVTESAFEVDETSDLLLEATRSIKEAVSYIDAGITQQSEDTENCLDQMCNLADKITAVHRSTNEINEITASTQEVIDNGMVIISDLNSKVQDTTDIMKYITQAISELNKESKSIYGIIATINDIAEETNLLSLNASIEAARAGEAGKGFAVVSDQIRKLAEQSSEAGTKIGDIIAQIQEKMVKTMQTAEKADEIVEMQEEALENTVEAFKTIRNKVNILAKDIDNISDSVAGIENAKNDTMEAIESISATSNETEAASNELSRSAERQLMAVENLSNAVKKLKNDADELDESVSIFKVE